MVAPFLLRVSADLGSVMSMIAAYHAPAHAGALQLCIPPEVLPTEVVGDIVASFVTCYDVGIGQLSIHESVAVKNDIAMLPCSIVARRIADGNSSDDEEANGRTTTVTVTEPLNEDEVEGRSPQE